MFGKAEKRKVEEIRNAVATVSRGVFKRVDENRELYELIKAKAPELLAQHPYIEGWLGSHDHFFTEIARLTNVENKIGQHSSVPYPRPWPGTRPLP